MDMLHTFQPHGLQSHASEDFDRVAVRPLTKSAMALSLRANP